ncbi:cupin domain-containing protein [Saccharothrix sp. AJ9571]|nr:cupin domain-containing protein [Saccharothrix sp. AJ9571]
MTHPSSTAQILGLAPHPEGGWYRRVYTSPLTVVHPIAHEKRPTASLIHYLLPPGEQSQWHTVASDEIWLWHRGGPLTLVTSPPGPKPTTETTHRLGQRIEDGEQLQCHVPAGHWQRAFPTGNTEVLVSCLVTPGFDFADFELATDAVSRNVVPQD